MCAAPSNAFRTKSLKATKEAITIDCLIAIPPSEPTDPEAKKALLKARFYLDEILAVDEYDSAGTKIAGFIGACYVGSANHAMHAEARRFTLDGTKGTEMDFFNDAGLNTLGKVSQPPPPSYDGQQAVFDLEVISAHFVNTDGVILNYSINGGALTGDIISPYYVPSGQTEVKQLAVAGAQPTDVVSIYFGAVNVEGTYKIGPFSYTIPYYNWAVKGPATWPSQTLQMIPISLYPASFPVGVGTVIKPTSNGSFARIDAGYYSTDDYWYQLTDNNSTDSQVVSMGIVGAWPAGDPEYTPPVQEWIIHDFVHYSAFVGDGCFTMDNPGFPKNPKRIWENENGKFYASQSIASGYAPAGYYYDGTKSGGKSRWQRLESTGEFWADGTYGVCN